MKTIILDKREYVLLNRKLATLGAGLKYACKPPEASPKVRWWRRFWRLGSKAAVVALVVVVLFGRVEAQEAPFAYGSWWASLGQAGQLLYLEGYKEGYFCGMLDVVPALDNIRPKEDEYFAFKLLRPVAQQSPFSKDIDLETMRRMISEIYRDPANMYIDTTSVIRVSADKLAGKPIEKALERYRAGVWEFKALREKLEQQKKK